MDDKKVYDGNMDEECIALCNALNSLPGVSTFESCCGHLNGSYNIWLNTSNLYSMSVIARAFDKRYVNTNVIWRVCIETEEIDTYPMFCIRICSEDMFLDKESMMHDVDELRKSIEYWSGDGFKKYFKI